MVEKAIRDILITSTGVSSIVAKRVYNGFPPQEVTLPFIVFKREATDRFRTLSGANGLVVADVEINCLSLTASQLQTLSDEVRQSLDNYAGTNKGVTIQRAMIDDESDDIEIETSGSDKRVRRRALDFRVFYCETPAA